MFRPYYYFCVIESYKDKGKDKDTLIQFNVPHSLIKTCKYNGDMYIVHIKFDKVEHCI